MKTTEAAHFIGQRRHWRQSAMLIEVSIIDVQERFGRIDVLIQPVAGSGQKWVMLDSLEESAK